MTIIDDYDTLENWFVDVSLEKTEPTLVYYVGSTGVGKKTEVNRIINNEDYRCININCIYDKDHSRFKKKNFVSELCHIITNKNIEFFLSGKKDVVIIHNLHVITDKSFYDELLDLKSKVKFVTPVICILNKSYISERFLSYMTKNCYVFNCVPKTNEQIKLILDNVSRRLCGSDTPKYIIDIIPSVNGNIYAIVTQLKNYILTGHLNKNLSQFNKIDKNIVSKCFQDLCDTKGTHSWTAKLDIIKSQGSLIRLLMPSHVFAGLDACENIDFKTKHIISTNCMKNLSKGENISGTINSSYSSLLQCIYPTIKVSNPTIKNMILSNCQSTNNITNLPRLLYPHPEEQFIYILHYIIQAIELEQSRKKHKDCTNWNTWLPELSKLGLNELQQKYFKIFKNTSITKKKINRFLIRMNGAIPESIN
tara:strand:- start:10438 stop:11703 length:1266 start_codon:yes stop_codon:yes gene_type:complete